MTLETLGFGLAAWTSLVLTCMLLGKLLHNDWLLQTGEYLYERLDGNVLPLVREFGPRIVLAAVDLLVKAVAAVKKGLRLMVQSLRSSVRLLYGIFGSSFRNVWLPLVNYSRALLWRVWHNPLLPLVATLLVLYVAYLYHLNAIAVPAVPATLKQVWTWIYGSSAKLWSMAHTTTTWLYTLLGTKKEAWPGGGVFFIPQPVPASFSFLFSKGHLAILYLSTGWSRWLCLISYALFSFSPLSPLKGAVYGGARASHDMLGASLAEVYTWLNVIASESGLPTRLFATASFAWSFYVLNMTVGRLQVHKRLPIKVALVPIVAVATTVQLGGTWVVAGPVAALWWTIVSVVVWERDHRQRQQAERDFNRFMEQRPQGRDGVRARAGGAPPRGHFVLPSEGATPDKVFPAEVCCICLDTLAGEGEEGPYTLPCGHQGFHQPCLQQWLDTSQSMRCPACKQTIDPTVSWVQTVF